MNVSKLTEKQNQSKITENMSEVAYIKTDSHFVNVHITSNCNSIITSERKFDKGITVQTLKDKLELITGARSALMTIEVFDQNDVKVCDLKVSIFVFYQALSLCVPMIFNVWRNQRFKENLVTCVPFC